MSCRFFPGATPERLPGHAKGLSPFLDLPSPYLLVRIKREERMARGLAPFRASWQQMPAKHRAPEENRTATRPRRRGQNTEPKRTIGGGWWRGKQLMEIVMVCIEPMARKRTNLKLQRSSVPPQEHLRREETTTHPPEKGTNKREDKEEEQTGTAGS